MNFPAQDATKYISDQDSQLQKDLVEILAKDVYKRQVEVQSEETEDVTSMNYRRPSRNNWLEDMIAIMLVNEMHRRRCRYRNCRGWY